jgi:hypothetical protein
MAKLCASASLGEIKKRVLPPRPGGAERGRKKRKTLRLCVSAGDKKEEFSRQGAGARRGGEWGVKRCASASLREIKKRVLPPRRGDAERGRMGSKTLRLGVSAGDKKESSPAKARGRGEGEKGGQNFAEM